MADSMCPLGLQVTCVAVSPHAGPASEAAPRLLAGSLDGHVKIYELDSFKVLSCTVTFVLCRPCHRWFFCSQE